MTKESKEAKVPVEDLWIFIMCAIRYSMGRSSYMPSMTCEFVDKYKKYLLPEQVNQIYREVEHELEIYNKLGKTLGDDIDHKTWTNFVERKEKK